MMSETQMPEDSISYRQLLAYIDELQKGIGALAVAIEGQMSDHGYLPIAKAGNQCYWFLSSSINKPHGWRIKMVTRLLVPKGLQTTDHTLLYQVLTDSESAFDFPTVLCGRLEHSPLTEDQIYAGWNSNSFAQLHYRAEGWQYLSEEHGWFIARPLGSRLVHRIKGYLLNLLDVNSVALVSEKIVVPLVSSGDPDCAAPADRLLFPGPNQRE